MKKVIARLTSSVLAILLFATQNPILAQELAGSLISSEKTSASKPCYPEMLEEILDKRSEYVKHFRLSDLSMIAVAYSEQVHYKNGEKFSEIDNTLIEDGEEYINAESPFKVRISKKIRDKKLVTVNSGSHEISWNYVKKANKNKKIENTALTDEPEVLNEETAEESDVLKAKPEVAQIENLKTKSKKFANKSEELTSVSKCSSKAKYKNIEENIDFDYILSGLGLKENIILNKKLDFAENDSFDFEFNTDLKIEKDKTGNLNFLDQNNKIIFTMPKGKMWDSEGNLSNDVDYKFSEISGGYKISVLPNFDWINNPDRLFPIFIDPSLTYPAANVNVNDTYISETNPSVNYHDNTNFDRLKVGTSTGSAPDLSAFLKFSSLPQMNHGEMVTKADLKLYAFEYNDTNPKYINAKKVTETWEDETLTYNNKPSVDAVIQDCAKVDTANKWYEWNLTKLVKEWYESSNPNVNYGVELSSKVDGSSGVVQFIASENSLSAEKPQLWVHYRNFIGDEPYWSYTNCGSGMVNNYSGSLSVSENILAYSGLRNPLFITNTYNNSHYNEHANTYVQEENFVGGYTHSASTGYGWSLDFNQLIYEIQNSGSSQKMYSDGFRYLYIDDDGTWHHFKSTNVNDPLADCTDEDGLDLTLKHVDGKIELRSRKNDRLIFEKKAVSSPNNRCFVLISSADSDGNKIEYEYTVPLDSNQQPIGSSEKVTTIREKLSENILQPVPPADPIVAEDRETKITYNTNGTVSKITMPADNTTDSRDINFTYDGNKLAEIKYPDETGKELKTSYGYDSEGRLSKVSTNAGEGSSTRYTYKSNVVGNPGFFKIASVTEYGNENIGPAVEGNSVSFEYYMNQTEITHRTSPLNSSPIEITEIWQFDNDGRVTSARNKETDEMITQYYMNKNEKTGDKRLAYKVRHVNDTGKYTKNLIKNSAANSDNMANWSVVGNIAESTDTASLGAKSFKADQSNSSLLIATQNVSGISAPQGKKYTFSADVKIDKELSGGEGAFLKIGSDYSEKVYTTEGIWRRISVTTEIPANTNSIDCSFGIENSDGSAYFDCLQLEEGEFPNYYNASENSSFDSALAPFWTPLGHDLNVGDGIESGRLKITGDPSAEKGVYQDISINKDNAVLALRATAEGTSVPNTEPFPDPENPGEFIFPDPKYYVGCELTFEDIPTQKVKFSFNPYITGVQHVYGSINANDVLKDYFDELNIPFTSKKLISARIELGFNNNCNTVYFDDVQLCVDDKGVTYERDEKGYITKILDSTGDITEIERDPQSREVTKRKSLNNLTENTYYEKDPNDLNSPGEHKLKTRSSALDGHRKVTSYFDYDEHGNVKKVQLKGCCPCQKYIEINSEYLSNKNYLDWSEDFRGNRIKFEYKNEQTGLLEKTIAPNEIETKYEYENKRIKSVKNIDPNIDTSQDPDANVLSKISYNYTNHILDSITNSANVVYNFIRDKFGKMEQTKIGDQILSTNTYDDGNGLLRRVDYANNQSANFDYDNLGRLVKQYYQNNTNADFEYSYDNKSRLIKALDSVNNWETKFERDVYGRMAHIRRYNGNLSTDSNAVHHDYYYTKNNLVDHEKFRWGSVNQARYNAYLPGNRLKGSTVKTGGIDFCSDYQNFDHLGRKIHLALGSSANSDAGLIYHWNYTDGNSPDKTTTLVKDMSYKLRKNGEYDDNSIKKFSYTYDDMGNITDIKDKDDNLIVHYEYDGLNQIKRENNAAIGETLVYTYDLGGNITKKEIYSYTDGSLPQQPQNTVTYDYADANWKDKMTSYNGQAITYDAIGNPVSYRDGWTFGWSRGRKLDNMAKTGYDVNISCKYDDAGVRTQKTVTENNVAKTTDFVTNGIQVLAQKTGDDVIVWQIDGENSVLGFLYNDEQYYYLKNGQGDIVGIINKAGDVVANYTYDSWGKLISIIDPTIDTTNDPNANVVTNNPEHIGYINPLRCGGCYYDNETGLYYINNRYYDPETCRFIDVSTVSESTLNPEDAEAEIIGDQASGGLFKSIVSGTLHGLNRFGRFIGINTAAASAKLLNMTKDENGVYHANQDCWQRHFGFNDFYDWCFNLGTSMDKAKFDFKHNETNYIFWAWKGDYISLGAGAELGIYRYWHFGHWLADRSLAMSMSMTLEYKNKGDTTTIAYYTPTEKQWWITSFNPAYQNVNASDLTASFNVTFDSESKYNAFIKKWGSSSYWRFPEGSLDAILTF